MASIVDAVTWRSSSVISVLILGAGFLCAHRPLVDKCKPPSGQRGFFCHVHLHNWGAASFALTNIFATGDVYQSLLVEIPALIVPIFSAKVAKHGLEHHIATIGPLVLHRPGAWMLPNWR